MKKDLKGALVMLAIFGIIICALYYSVTSYPQGFLEAGHCNETEQSQVCWCDESEERQFNNETTSFECLKDER